MAALTYHYADFAHALCVRQVLRLQGCAKVRDDAGLDVLVASCPKLIEVNFSGSKLTHKGLEPFAQLKALATLDIGDTQLEGDLSFVQPSLTSLSVFMNTGISGTLDGLRAAVNLKKLMSANPP